MSSPAWADSSGRPTRYAILAALHVASVIDQTGSLVVDTRESYWHRAAGGRFGPSDFRMGEELLRDCNLVEEHDSLLYLKPEIAALLDATVDDAVATVYARAIAYRPEPEPSVSIEDLAEVLPDAERREELLRALGRRFDDQFRRELGQLGELIVLDALREQLRTLGYPELARAVRHLSLETDQAGYDISAPRLGGGSRLIEVKTVTNASDEVVFYLSRNEYETSQKYGNWYLVICNVTSFERREGEVAGWLPSTHLVEIVPTDRPRARWETVRITLSADVITPGIPTAG